MVLKWYESRILDDFQPTWGISNDALIGLYTVCDTGMSRERIRERYMPRIEESLVLFDKLIAFTEKRWHERSGIDDLDVIREISKDLGTSDHARIRAELEEKQTVAPKATRILNMIESVASAKVRKIVGR